MRTGRHGVVVVLARDLDHAGLEALHGMVGAVVPEGQLVGRAAQRRGQDLVAEADAEDRDPPDQVGHGGGRARQGGGVARAVGEEHAVGLERQHVVGRRAGRHHGDGAERGEQLHHGRLDAEVVGHDAQAARRAGARPRWTLASRVGDARHQVHAVGADGGGRGGAQLGLGSRAEGAGDRTGLGGRGGPGGGCRRRSGPGCRGGAGRARGPRSSASSTARRPGRTPRSPGSAGRAASSSAAFVP